MKKSFILISMTVIFIAMSSCATINAKRVIFFGDSITQFGTDSNGYITVMHRLLDSTGRSYQYDLIGAGIAGNKIYDLLFRVDADVIAKKPDIVYIFIGANDVWNKSSLRTGTDPDRFDRFYDALVARLQKAGATVVICTPLCLGEHKKHANPDDADLDRYAQMAREIAYRHHTLICDLRALFYTYNESHNPGNKRTGILTTDGIHLNDDGNLFVAQEMLKVLP